MLRVARLRDAKWQRPADMRRADEKPQMMSFSDALQIASALWVKEAGGVTDLKLLMFDDWSSNDANGSARLSLLRLQDYVADARANSDVMAAVRLTRIQPFRQTRPIPERAPAGQAFAKAEESQSKTGVAAAQRESSVRNKPIRQRPATPYPEWASASRWRFRAAR
jgi:hypothetical protein